MKIFLLPLIALVLTGCAAQTATTPATPVAPTPPQVTVANSVNALAQALDTAITGLRAARDAGKLTPADVANAERVAGAIALTGKLIDSELRSADDWPTQKTKIVGIVTQASLKNTVAAVRPGAAAYLAAAVAVYNTIASTVGGPTI